MLTQEQKQNLLQSLQQEKKDLEIELDRIRLSNPEGSLLEWTGELSAYDNHPADLGSETYEMEKQLALTEHEKYLLQQVEEALQLINTDGYGTCEYCGTEIPYERLEAVPYARICMKCAHDKKLPLQAVLEERPGEEDILRNGFGRRFISQDLDEGDDGLGIFRQLQSYGSADNMQDMLNVRDYKEMNELYAKMDHVDPLDNISNEEYMNQLPD